MKSEDIAQGVIQFFTKFTWQNAPLYFILAFLNFIFAATYSYFIIKLPKEVVEMLEVATVNIKHLSFIFIIVLLAGLGSAICKYFYTPIGYRIRYQLLLKIIKSSLSIPIEDYENPKNLDKIWNVYRPVTSIDGVQGMYLHFANLCGNLGIIIISVGILFRVNVFLALLIFIYIVLFLYLSKKSSDKKEKCFRDYSSNYREWQYLNDICTDSAYAKEFRVFQLQNWIHKKIMNVNKTSKVLLTKIENITANLSYFDTIYQFFRDIAIYGILVIMYFQRSISIAEFSTYSVLVMQLNNGLIHLQLNVEWILKQYSNYPAMIHYLSIPLQNNEGEHLQLKNGYEIEFVNVTFKYPGTNTNIYENLNFKIEEGKRIAIIGLNGVGKTTFVKLLMRLYKPTLGEIKINGVNIEKFKIDEYFELFAPVFQDINIFPFSIIENIAFDEYYDKTRIFEVLKQLDLYNKLSELDNGLDTLLTKYLNQNGIVLSGGELQRLAMSRAIYSNRPILILDEPTSAFDAVAEYDFYEKINTTYKSNTILFISHRLASTSFCDEIVLVSDKTILEKGTHNELMALKGKYYELFHVQSKYYKEEAKSEV